MDKKENILKDKAAKNLPFSVPENYFNDFAAEMDRQIMQKQKRIPMRRNLWLYSAAAVFVGLLAVGQVFYSNYQQEAAYMEDYETYVLSQVGGSAIYYFDDIYD